MTPLVVLLASPLPPPRGGMATWTELTVGEAQRHKDISLRIFDTAIRWRKIHELEIWRRALGGGLQLLRSIKQIRAAIRQERPSVMHLSSSGHMGFVRDIFVLRMAKRMNVRTVLHLHFGRLPELSVKRNWEWRLAQCAFKAADAVIVLDQHSLDALRQHSPNTNAVKLPNCLSLEKVKAITPTAPTASRNALRITYIGWVLPAKGVLELAQAAARLSRRYPLELEIIGPFNPEYRTQVESAAAPLGSNFLWRGEREHSEAMQALHATDIFVLPSYTEGFPNVIMEAMACGKPIVATDVGAIAEMLEWKQPQPCGLIVPPKDSQALEQALEKLLSDPALRSQLGQRAKARCESEYSTSVVFEKLKRVWAPSMA